jgi:hypothetical protein
LAWSFLLAIAIAIGIAIEQAHVDPDTDPGKETTMIDTHVVRDLRRPAQSPMDVLMKK